MKGVQCRWFFSCKKTSFFFSTSTNIPCRSNILSKSSALLRGRLITYKFHAHPLHTSYCLVSATTHQYVFVMTSLCLDPSPPCHDIILCTNKPHSISYHNKFWFNQIPPIMSSETYSMKPITIYYLNCYSCTLNDIKGLSVFVLFLYTLADTHDHKFCCDR